MCEVVELKKKIGIACGCRRLNYGSILQSYALCETVKKMGYDCKFVWIKGNLFKHTNIRIEKIIGLIKQCFCYPSLIPKVFKGIMKFLFNKNAYNLPEQSKKAFESFIQSNISISNYSHNELKKVEKRYFKFLCGSDQIWNSFEYFMDPMYFLRFTNHSKRIAYAPSFGTDKVSYYNRNNIKKYLSEFDYISVREKSGQKICKHLISRDVPVVLDPTLLISKEEWISLQNLKTKEEEYCLVYFLSYPCKEAIELIKSLSIPIKYLPVKYDCFDKCENAGPKEFLELLLGAKYVITDSFHGTIFSINFEKQFLTFDRNYNTENSQSSRIRDILNVFSLQERFNPNKEKTAEILKKQVDYEKVRCTLEKCRKESIEFLANSISGYRG